MERPAEIRRLFVQVAEGLGIRGILHRDYPSTRARLAALGLPLASTFEPKD